MVLDDDRNGKVRFGAKSEFVRSLDRSIPAARVVELASERGIKVTPGFVYNIRSNSAQRDLHRPRPAPAEAALREAIAQIGLARARQILDEVEATFAGRPKAR